MKPFCASSVEAQLLPDEEFWARVFEQGDPSAPFDQDYDFDEVGTWQQTPCRVCGTFGACGYDSEGRVLIHATEEDDK